MSKVEFYNRLKNNSSGLNPFKPKNYSPAMKKILSVPDNAKRFLQFMEKFAKENPNNKLSDLVEGAKEQGEKPITIDRLKAVVRFLNEGSDNAFRAMIKGVSKGNEINVIFVEQIEGLKESVDKFKKDSEKEEPKQEMEVMAGGETQPMEDTKAQPKKGNLRKTRFDKVDEEIKKEKDEFDKLAKETSKNVVDEMMNKIKLEIKKEEEEEEVEDYLEFKKKLDEDEEIEAEEADENGEPLGSEEEKKEKIEEIKKERREENDEEEEPLILRRKNKKERRENKEKQDKEFNEFRKEFNEFEKELELEKEAKVIIEEALGKIKLLKGMKEKETDDDPELREKIINEEIARYEEQIRRMEQTSQPPKQMELKGTGSQEKEVPIKDVPSSVIPLPDERKSAEFKTENQLLEDINYFFKTYEPILKDSLPRYEKIIKISDDKIRLRDLKDLHRRLVALIGDTDKKEDEFKLGISKDGKTVGIILNADKYLDEKINMILLEKITNGLKPEDLLVNVEIPEDKTDSKRVGSYELTKGRSGILSATRAPVYRSIPSTAPKDSDDYKPKDKRRFGPIELKSLPSQEWNQVNAAKKMVRLEDIVYSERDRKPDRLKIYL
jgi:hypothetical protein